MKTRRSRRTADLIGAIIPGDLDADFLGFTIDR